MIIGFPKVLPTKRSEAGRQSGKSKKGTRRGRH